MTALPKLVSPEPVCDLREGGDDPPPARTRRAPGVHPTAVVGAGARIAASAIGRRACGDRRRRDDRRARARSARSARIGDGAAVGDDALLHARVTVYARCVIGARTIIHSGAVIGADGFGMAEEAGRWLKIPQVGRVVVGADVEIGANTTIDRGAIDDTVIEDDVKLDNQIQIGHNCRIGAHTAIAGCTGISGSVRIGRNCRIGGAAMIAGHLSIADGTVISAGTGVMKTIDVPGIYSGMFPILPYAEWKRVAVEMRRLRSLAQRVAALERGTRDGKGEERGMTASETGGMDILEIMRYLPHRYPMLLIDRVTSFIPATSIRGLKNVTMNEPFFQGHFPEFPVMPGVLVIEALAQLASILAWRTAGRVPGDGTLLFFAGIDHARFRRRVLPGDQLRLESDLHPSGAWRRQALGAGARRRRDRCRGRTDGGAAQPRGCGEGPLTCRASTRPRSSIRRPNSPPTSRLARSRSSGRTSALAPAQ